MKGEDPQMHATRSSEGSIVVPLLLVGVALFGLWSVGGAFWSFAAVAAVIYLVVRILRPDGGVADSGLAPRVAGLERKVAVLHAAVDQLRTERAAPAAPTEPRKQPAATPPPAPPPPRPAPTPTPTPNAVDWARSVKWRPKVSTVDLLGAKALAFTGGVVTLLGVLFFFVLAVNRGWIGPEIRVACGGIASAILVGSGVWLKRRYGATYSALTAVGTGLAGAYATLLAATSLYDLLSKPVALVVAAAIAATGLAISLVWSSEIVAGFGLIGAMLVPATLVFQGGLQQIGTAFVAVVFAAAAVVAVRQRWWRLLQVAAVVSAPQALAQASDADAPGAAIVTLAAVFWLLFVAAGVAFQLRLGRALRGAPASFLTGGAVFAGLCAALLYNDRSLGFALLIAAGVYAALAAAFFKPARELATLLWALALTGVAVGLAEVLSGSSLTYAWAAEAALLAWLSTRVRDERFQLPALAYLGLALLHTLAYEANPDHLFEVSRHPAAGAPAVLAVALAALVFGRVDRSWDDRPPAKGILRVLDPPLRSIALHKTEVAAAAFTLAALLVVYAASLGILELFQAIWPGDGLVAPFEWGHVAVTGAWSLAGVVAVIVALVRRSALTLWLALAWLGATILKSLLFDYPTLTRVPGGISLLVVGAAALIAGLAREAAADRRLTEEGCVALIGSFALVIAGGVILAPTVRGDGFVLVGIGALYVALAAAALARALRDTSTLLWALGFTGAFVGEAVLLQGVWLVLAYTSTAAALAGLSVWISELRLQVGALLYLAAGAALAIVAEAPPSHFVTAMRHPAAGVPSLLLVIASTAVLAGSLGWSERYRLQAIWTAGALGVYAASLAILEAVQRISPETVHTDFQRGHTIVSAFWGILALISLYVGLTRQGPLLRGGGFILFAVSLGKIFLFDLPSLSSAQRALSFLAVGAVLLLGGFFYQRLSAQYE
jgi:uncharacterized membrane protein